MTSIALRRAAPRAASFWSALCVLLALFAFGLGGIVGNTIGGRMSDWSVLRTIVIASVGMSVVLVVLALVATWFVAAVLFVFIASLVAAGRHAEAAPLVEAHRRQEPDFSVAAFLPRHGLRDPDARARFGERLLAAGLAH